MSMNRRQVIAAALFGATGLAIARLLPDSIVERLPQKRVAKSEDQPMWHAHRAWLNGREVTERCIGADEAEGWVDLLKLDAHGRTYVVAYDEWTGCWFKPEWGVTPTTQQADRYGRYRYTDSKAADERKYGSVRIGCTHSPEYDCQAVA